MRAAASALLAGLDEPRAALGHLPFEDDQSRRWIEYRPEPRPGASLSDLGPAQRKAAHRLLATGLSPYAYAQAMTIIGLEETLDRRENWVNERHSNDYWVVVFGEPDGDQPWAWRFEGHHLSVTMTVRGEEVSPAPVFLGANPARVSYAGRDVVRPLAPEEDLARDLLDAMGDGGRAQAVVADEAPVDIHSSVRPRVRVPIEPRGIAAVRLDASARTLLDQLVGLYLGRLPDEVAAREVARVNRDELHFAWEGPLRPGQRHYYRIQGPDLLLEYDNTSEDGNHAHTVLRRPLSDFGEDVLGNHRAARHTDRS
ncbi:hypothetical protein Raf01_91150 [Rugosimonospora africana]|uniref:DUF3500 domain-containing protein n=2 Tax=Rugosimonospora africana TaxID=556532 RepID=A0A8J3R1V0_9ACTN|nr:hypothetical protein Raf01_91150 [Rugosimonospora africana]